MSFEELSLKSQPNSFSDSIDSSGRSINYTGSENGVVEVDVSASVFACDSKHNLPEEKQDILQEIVNGSSKMPAPQHHVNLYNSISLRSTLPEKIDDFKDMNLRIPLNFEVFKSLMRFTYGKLQGGTRESFEGLHILFIQAFICEIKTFFLI